MDYFGQDLDLLARIAAAMLFGGVLGFEREMGRHSAGLRTHMLIAGAAALIVGLGDIIATNFAEERYRDLVSVDPVRLIQAVVAGVGFVAGGAILSSRDEDRVRGLTTASSLVMAAAIGVAAGLSEYVLAAGAGLLCVAVLYLLGAVDIPKRKPPD